MQKELHGYLDIRINFVDIWMQARTWMRLEKTLLPNSSEVVRVK